MMKNDLSFTKQLVFAYVQFYIREDNEWSTTLRNILVYHIIHI